MTPSEAASPKSRRNPWSWVPSLYFAEGIPYVVVMIVSVIMYKRLGISNTQIALYTSWLYLPWVIKPLWSPFVDILKTKRFWIVTMQLIIGAGLAGVALTIPGPNFLKYSLAVLWLLAFSSATHDIAADGFYMLGLSEHDQAWFVGVRSTFYRIAMITGQGLLIMLAGYIETSTGLPPVAVDVRVDPLVTSAPLPHPDSLAFARPVGPMQVLPYPAAVVNIQAFPRSQAAVDSVLAFARGWNRAQGFYEAPGGATTAGGGGAEEPSWWSRVVVVPLESALTNWFGAEIPPAETDGRVGNIGVVYLTLSGAVPPGEEVVVNFGRSSGDNSIMLVEGERFIFTEANGNRPMVAVIQIDKKLRTASEARFLGRSGNIPLAWSITFYVLAGMFLLFFMYHRFMLPYPKTDVPARSGEASNLLAAFGETFVSFFRKKHSGLIIAFLLFYRFGEAQLVKLASPFLLDAQEVGGLALTTGEVGFVYGTVGILSLTIGGLLGGFLAARHGLKYWLWWMVIAINLPNAVYIFLSYTVPDSFLVINLAVAVEQFGYGFGFTAYMLYMIYAAEGEHKTAHFAICTGFMALGMMIPGMFSGWLQDLIGYQHFFVWVLLATIPGFVVTYFIPLDPAFGKKTEEAS